MSNNKLLSNFSLRIGKLLDDDDEFNTTIFVGGNKSSSIIKTFKAHSILLKINSSYFENVLKNNNNNEYTKKIYLENISPPVFEVILKFMYTGKISMENRTRDDIIELLEAAEELKLDELSEFLQDHLMQKKDCVINDNNDNNDNTQTSIQEADLILSDKLVSEEVLELIPKHTEVFIAARKFCANVEAAQAELNRVGLDALNLGKYVVRLKQGDPFLLVVVEKNFSFINLMVISHK
ncbi:unnamed protein product [Rhizophagus irregularis]|nr:unnamed protein product [Rhizophagus irregularis]